MVLELEDIVQIRAEKLTALAKKAFSTGNALNLHYVFRSISVDVITDYAFGQCYDLLDRPDFGEPIFDMIQGLGPTMWAFIQWPGLQKVALGLPPAIASFLSPPVGQVIQMTAVCAPSFLSQKY